MKKLYAVLFSAAALFALSCANAQSAANVEHPSTVVVKSDSVQSGSVKAVVILPDNYDTDKTKRYPVVYLLHGYGDNEQKWIKEKPALKDLATEFGLIIVCPDGKRSWYWDSVKNPKDKYETFISKDLVSYVDSNYRTLASPKFRAITGLSMGGHGGLWNGLRHPDVFGACGSMSGGVDIRPFPKNWSMAANLGNYENNKEVWESHTVINLVDGLKPGASKIIFDCGVNDFFYKVNEALHAKLLEKKIPHDYISRPGGHSWDYWRNSIEYQLLFFNNFFKSNIKSSN